MKLDHDALRGKIRQANLTCGDDVLFDLMLLGCSACCETCDGGNRTCPPKVTAS